MTGEITLLSKEEATREYVGGVNGAGIVQILENGCT